MNATPQFSNPAIPDVTFQEPRLPARLRREPRREGRGYDFTPDEIDARLKKWESEGRLCAASGGRCFHNAATRELTVVVVNEKGEPLGEPYIVKTCSNHRKNWIRNGMYRVLSEQPLRTPKPGA